MDELIFKVVPDYTSRLTQLKKQEIDLAELIKTEDVKDLQKESHLVIRSQKGREYDCSSVGLDGKNRMRFSPMAATVLSLRRCGTVPPSSLPAAWLSGCRGNWESL